jgi:DnaD/phage-associated family protein
MLCELIADFDEIFLDYLYELTTAIPKNVEEYELFHDDEDDGDSIIFSLAVFRILGIKAHIPNKKELSLIEKWTGEYEMPQELILQACEKILLVSSKTSLSKLDKLLTAWHKAGVKNMEDMEAATIKFLSLKK